MGCNLRPPLRDYAARVGGRLARSRTSSGARRWQRPENPGASAKCTKIQKIGPNGDEKCCRNYAGRYFFCTLSRLWCPDTTRSRHFLRIFSVFRRFGGGARIFRFSPPLPQVCGPPPSGLGIYQGSISARRQARFSVLSKLCYSGYDENRRVKNIAGLYWGNSYKACLCNNNVFYSIPSIFLDKPPGNSSFPMGSWSVHLQQNKKKLQPIWRTQLNL